MAHEQGVYDIHLTDTVAAEFEQEVLSQGLGPRVGGSSHWRVHACRVAAVSEGEGVQG